MKKLFLISILMLYATASNNTTQEANITINTKKDNNNSLLEENVKKMIEKEKKYKIEQKFYMGDDYNLTEHEVDKKTLEKVPLIEPEYDFDITDLYAD